MLKILNDLIAYFSTRPGKLFLLDGSGAALTTFFLFFVLRPLYDYFGMPPHILTYLAAIGLLYFTYSMTCYFFLRRNRAPFLRVISIGNFLYCVLTMAFVYYYFDSLTLLGLTYFIVEIMVILMVVHVELRVAKQLKS